MGGENSVLEVHKASWKNPLNNGSERLAKCPIIVENGATTGLSAHFQGRSVEVCFKQNRFESSLGLDLDCRKIIDWSRQRLGWVRLEPSII